MQKVLPTATTQNHTATNTHPDNAEGFIKIPCQVETGPIYLILT